jgi:hypothetical protein
VRRVIKVLLLGGALTAAGCLLRPTDKQRYVPADSTAQLALETALTVWQTSGATGQVQESGPAIHLLDSQHQPGQTLAGFEILGNAAGDAERCYTVRLCLKGPHEEVRTRYVVFGDDPLWVVRYEDYEMIIHWDMRHDMHGSAAVSGRSADAR